MSWVNLERVRTTSAVALAGVTVAAALALVPDHQIVYSRQLTVIGCNRVRADAVCAVWARLSIGNTGNVDHAAVRVRLPAIGAVWRVDARASDLWASLATRAEPRVARLEGGEIPVYEIRPLPRNKVVDINAYCLGCPALRGVDASQIEVESDGPVSEGDPRGITLLGALGRLVSALIPLS